MGKQIKQIKEQIDLLNKSVGKLQNELKETIRIEIAPTSESMHLIKEKFSVEAKYQIDQLKTTATNIFENAEFIKGFKHNLHNFVSQEIRVVMEEHNVQKVMRDIARDKIKDELSEIIEQVVNRVVTTTNNKLKREYSIAKELAYSIDSTIKHTLINIPLSYNDSEIIKNKIIGILDKVKVNKTKQIN